MFTLFKLPDDSFTLREERYGHEPYYFLRSVPLEDIIRFMLVGLQVPGHEIMDALKDMELTKSNVAEFGISRTYVLCRTVRYNNT